MLQKVQHHSMDKGVPIRSISRGIAVLKAINRGGTTSLSAIARSAGVPYPTTCRIVQTLLHEGLIEREPGRKYYRPTALVRALAHGFEGEGHLVQIARPHIMELTRIAGWPISLATPAGHSMVIRDSTHAMTALTFNHYHPGYPIPMLECAAGLVYLSHLPDDDRTDLLATLDQLPDAANTHMVRLFAQERFAEIIRAQGHATRAYNAFTRNPGKTSSIAVPIPHGSPIVGTLTLAFFAAAMPMDQAVAQFAEPLKQTAARIADDLRSDTD